VRYFECNINILYDDLIVVGCNGKQYVLMNLYLKIFFFANE
jgi:hypothetical protein